MTGIETQDDVMTEVLTSPTGPGLYPGVDALEYHRWPGASQSRLKILRDHTPAHLRWALDHPEEPTDAMRLGAAVHTCILEPDLFALVYVRGIEGDGRTKAVQVAREAQRVKHPHAHILRAKEYDICLAIREAVAAHPSARHLLEGEHESSAVWRDPGTGILCRARFDDIARGIGCLTDLKTTVDASPHRFPRDIYALGYHIQSAHYLRGAQVLGIEADSFAIVAVEKEPPYAVAIYQLNAASIQDGERELDPLLERWAACEVSGVWPGYPTEVVVVDLPSWAPQEITRRIGGAA